MVRLRELEKTPLSEDVIAEIRKTLSGKNNVLVARAAQVAERRNILDLIPELVKAFGRFMNNPIKTDKGCLAKNAIVEALDSLGYDGKDIFLQGIRHIQFDEAFEYLIDVVNNEHKSKAIAALEGLKIFQTNDVLRARIEEAVESHSDDTIREAWYTL